MYPPELHYVQLNKPWNMYLWSLYDGKNNVLYRNSFCCVLVGLRLGIVYWSLLIQMNDDMQIIKNVKVSYIKTIT